jgi:predicted TIM-barrel fold metal-dependent hydrolase
MLIEKNMILLTHASEPVGHEYAGKGSVTPDTLYPFIIDNPELSIVCAHWGGGLPFYALMPEVASALKNTYFDTAASPFLYKAGIFNVTTEIIGSDHILFGSDYPLMPQKRILEQAAASGLQQKDLNNILGLNAKKLLSL